MATNFKSIIFKEILLVQEHFRKGIKAISEVKNQVILEEQYTKKIINLNLLTAAPSHHRLKIDHFNPIPTNALINMNATLSSPILTSLQWSWVRHLISSSPKLSSVEQNSTLQDLHQKLTQLNILESIQRTKAEKSFF